MIHVHTWQVECLVLQKAVENMPPVEGQTKRTERGKKKKAVERSWSTRLARSHWVATNHLSPMLRWLPSLYVALRSEWWRSVGFTGGLKTRFLSIGHLRLKLGRWVCVCVCMLVITMSMCGECEWVCVCVCVRESEEEGKAYACGYRIPELIKLGSLECQCVMQRTSYMVCEILVCLFVCVCCFGVDLCEFVNIFFFHSSYVYSHVLILTLSFLFHFLTFFLFLPPSPLSSIFLSFYFPSLSHNSTHVSI